MSDYDAILRDARAWERMRIAMPWGDASDYITHMRREGFIIPRKLARKLRTDL